MKKTKKIISLALALIMVLSLCSVTAFAGNSVAYIGADGKPATATATELTCEVTEWDEEWYYVTDELEINDVELKGNVNLILGDDACLTLIYFKETEYTLTIYGQTSGSGELHIVSSNDYYGIKGNLIVNGGNVDIPVIPDSETYVWSVYGNLTVNGGNVKITATSLDESTQTRGVKGNVTINGGNVEITCNVGKIVDGTLSLTENVSVNYGDNSSSTTTLSAPVVSTNYATIKAAKYAKFVSHTHTLTQVPVKSATCTEPGVTTAYWKCTDASCGKCFTAQTGGNEITKEQLTATYIEAAKGHDFSGTLVQGTDGNVGKHAALCKNGCGKYGTVNGEAHTEGWVTCTCDQTSDTTHKATDATCTDAATYYKTCVCGYCAGSGETFAYGSPNGHDFSGTLVQGEGENAGKHAAKCANCDAYGTVISGVHTEGWVTCTCDQTDDTTHQKSPADCTNAEQCYKTCICGYCDENETFENGSALGHSFDTENWTYDETQHWHAATCGHDTEKDSVDNHVDEDVKDHKCDVCGKVLSECKDDNGDGKCDYCGKDMGVPITPTKPAQLTPLGKLVTAAVKTTVKIVETVKAVAVAKTVSVIKAISRLFR